MNRRVLPAALLGGVLAFGGCAAAQPAPPEPTEALRDLVVIRGEDDQGGNYSVTTGCYGANRVFLRGTSVAATLDPTCTVAVAR